MLFCVYSTEGDIPVLCVQQWDVHLFFLCVQQGEGKTYMFYALVVDRLSRILFPAMFLMFNLFYWPYYLYMHEAADQSLRRET